MNRCHPGFAAILLAAAMGGAAAQGVIKADGSSTVFPVTREAAVEFEKLKIGAARVEVAISGTSGGFKKFCNGETDISNASRPIVRQEMEACARQGIRYYEIPVAFDALTVAVHPSNTFVKQLTVEQLKTMWEPGAQGRITSWKQIDPAFPDEPFKLFGAGGDSGTFDYFTEAVVGKARSSRADYTASEDDDVLVRGVAGDANAIGYFGYAYYIESKGKLRAVPVVNKAGKAVAPADDSVVDGSYNPLSRPVFIYVAEKSMNRPEVREFVIFYLRNAVRLTQRIKYVALPWKSYEITLAHVEKRKLGTVFNGVGDVGITINGLLARQAKL